MGLLDGEEGSGMGEVGLFLAAEATVAEVLGRIGPADGRIVAGPVLDRAGWDSSAPLRVLVSRFCDDEVRITGLLGGQPAADIGDLRAVIDATCAAARRSAESSGGSTGVPADVLREAVALRCFLAHDVAMALGSRACPLPEDLARGMFEVMEPAAEHWRSAGVFRDRMPLPAGHVSWRDRFLLLAGRDPHPFLA